MKMWKKLICDRKDLQLMFTLCGGQTFRWKKTADSEWTGVFSHKIWTLSQTDDCILYKVVGCRKEASKNKINVDSDEENEAMLRNYLRLDTNLDDFYESWSASDHHFKEAATKFNGVRILAQDPTENLFSFICSSNNHISRISSMVEKLCTFYGSPISEVNGVLYYDFPPASALAGPLVEKRLKDAGFGYRARYIHQSACQIAEMGGTKWLDSLKEMPYLESKKELMKLTGIGPKVADCICLMSLGHLEAIPVDTHIFQVAVARYLPHLKACKSVTDRVYAEIGDHFRDLYGSHAGWAHTILFCSDLKMFQEKETKALKKKSEPSKSKTPIKKKKRS